MLQPNTESETGIYKTPSGRGSYHAISYGLSHEHPVGYWDLFSANTAVTSDALLGRKQQQRNSFKKA